MESSRRRTLRRLVLVIDGLIVVAAMLLAFGLHSALRPHLPLLKDPPRLETYATLAYVALPLWLGLTVWLGLHRVFERRWTRGRLLLDLLKLHAAGLVALGLVLFVTNVQLNRSLVGLFLGCTFVLLYLERGLIGLWLRYQYRTGRGRLRLLLVGWPETVMGWFVDVAAADEQPPALVGFLTPDGDPARGDHEPPGVAREHRLRTPSQQLPRHLGPASELGRVLHDEAVDQVLFFPPLNGPAAASAMLDACERVGVPAAFAIDLVERDRVTPRVIALYEQPFVAFEATPRRPEALALKHALDVVCALLGLIVLAPLLLLVAVAVRLTMGRPVLFAQERVGLFGRRFPMFKFRTMVPDAETRRAELEQLNEMDGPVFKAADDPRVTRLGRLLRRTSVDELPQLLNVLRGEMSLVGPRPLPVAEQQAIRGAQRRRLSMKPGITGLWQVSGRSDLGFDDWMALDVRYVDRWSFRLDLWLLLRTIPRVLSGRGAR